MCHVWFLLFSGPRSPPREGKCAVDPCTDSCGFGPISPTWRLCPSARSRMTPKPSSRRLSPGSMTHLTHGREGQKRGKTVGYPVGDPRGYGGGCAACTGPQRPGRPPTSVQTTSPHPPPCLPPSHSPPSQTGILVPRPRGSHKVPVFPWQVARTPAALPLGLHLISRMF